MSLPLFLLIVAGALPSCQSATIFNTRGIPFLDSRYVAWDSLEEAIQNYAIGALGYSNFSWNRPGTASIEALALSTISPQQMSCSSGPNATASPDCLKMKVLAAMNLDDEDQWDCWVNHYTDYFWEEMDNATIAAWEALGWNVSSWNGVSPYPESENKEWTNLTETEQQGAVELCYLEEIWSGTPLPWTGVDYAALAMNLSFGSAAVNVTGEDEEDEISLLVEEGGEDDIIDVAISKSSGLGVEEKEIPVEEEAAIVEEESAASTVRNSVVWGLLALLAWQV